MTSILHLTPNEGEMVKLWGCSSENPVPPHCVKHWLRKSSQKMEFRKKLVLLSMIGLRLFNCKKQTQNSTWKEKALKAKLLL